MAHARGSGTLSRTRHHAPCVPRLPTHDRVDPLGRRDLDEPLGRVAGLGPAADRDVREPAGHRASGSPPDRPTSSGPPRRGRRRDAHVHDEQLRLVHAGPAPPPPRPRGRPRPRCRSPPGSSSWLVASFIDHGTVGRARSGPTTAHAPQDVGDASTPREGEVPAPGRDGPPPLELGGPSCHDAADERRDAGGHADDGFDERGGSRTALWLAAILLWAATLVLTLIDRPSEALVIVAARPADGDLRDGRRPGRPPPTREPDRLAVLRGRRSGSRCGSFGSAYAQAGLGDRARRSRLPPGRRRRRVDRRHQLGPDPAGRAPDLPPVLPRRPSPIPEVAYRDRAHRRSAGTLIAIGGVAEAHQSSGSSPSGSAVVGRPDPRACAASSPPAGLRGRRGLRRAACAHPEIPLLDRPGATTAPAARRDDHGDGCGHGRSRSWSRSRPGVPSGRGSRSSSPSSSMASGS